MDDEPVSGPDLGVCESCLSEAARMVSISFGLPVPVTHYCYEIGPRYTSVSCPACWDAERDQEPAAAAAILAGEAFAPV